MILFTSVSHGIDTICGTLGQGSDYLGSFDTLNTEEASFRIFTMNRSSTTQLENLKTTTTRICADGIAVSVTGDFDTENVYADPNYATTTSSPSSADSSGGEVYVSTYLCDRMQDVNRDKKSSLPYQIQVLKSDNQDASVTLIGNGISQKMQLHTSVDSDYAIYKSGNTTVIMSKTGVSFDMTISTVADTSAQSAHCHE